MRPCGHIRQALRDAAWAGAGDHGVTWRDLAQRACVGFTAARHTVENMARAGELQATGSVQVHGVCRPMTLYEPVSQHADACRSIDGVLRLWVR